MSEHASPPLIIVNPASASGATGKRWPSVAPQVLSLFPEAQIKHTSARGEASKLAREALEAGLTHIISVGGDGTAHEVAQGLLSEQGEPLNPALTLSLLPMGTGSDLCRSLGIPRELSRAVETLRAPPRPVDVGWVTTGGGSQGQVALNIASLGLSGLVVNHVESYGKGGQLAYLKGIFSASKGYQNPTLKLSFTDAEGQQRVLERVCCVCAVANGRYFGGNMPIAPNALLDDGLFQLVLVGDLSLWEVTQRLPALYRGTHLSKPKFESYWAREVLIEPLSVEPVLVEVDGEPLGALPMRFEMKPSAFLMTTGRAAPAFTQGGER